MQKADIKRILLFGKGCSTLKLENRYREYSYYSESNLINNKKEKIMDQVSNKDKNLMDQIESVKAEELELIFSEFSHETAINLGYALHEKAKILGVSVTIDIRKGDHILFHLAMEGTSPNNDRWVKRKSNTVQFLHMSSYRAGLENILSGETLASQQYLNPMEYAEHGGSFPLTIKGTGVIGAVTVSGLPQKKDHELVVGVLRSFIADNSNS